MSTPSPQLPLGQVIGSRYRVQSLIGRGGMGMVYAAMHELTGRRVALKLMVNESDDAPVLHDRFLSEARIAAAVRHPNIVDVLDMGLHGGAPFLVMELLEGRSLEQVLQQQKFLSLEQTLIWLFPIVGALAVLHDAGIVHRDIKPSNIFMSSLPRHPMRPKLLDFGLARVVSDLRLTRSGTVIGTPLYMAPEHAAGMSTGPQADVWSISVVLYESLAGCSPFSYTDRSSLAMQVLAGMVKPIQEVRPDLPEPVSSVIMRGLQRDLTRRYAGMRELARALHAAARQCNVPVPFDPDPIGLPDYTTWQTGIASATTQEHVPPSFPPKATAQLALGATVPLIDSASMAQSRRPPWRWLWALPVLVLALVLGALWKRASRPEPVVMPASASMVPEAAPASAPSAASPLRNDKPTVESLAPRMAREEEKPPVRATPAAKRRSATTVHRAPVNNTKPNTQDEIEAEWK